MVEVDGGSKLPYIAAAMAATVDYEQTYEGSYNSQLGFRTGEINIFTIW
jgi:hypothetical protein